MAPCEGSPTVTSRFPSWTANNDGLWWFVFCSPLQIIQANSQVFSELKCHEAYVISLECIFAHEVGDINALGGSVQWIHLTNDFTAQRAAM